MQYLYRNKNFKYFFWTQFLGAFNDNLFKNALVIFITFNASSDLESGNLSSLASGLFILPFIIFSSIAGQITDKYEKSSLITQIKFCEIVIMLLGAFAFYFKMDYLLLFILFLMGTQSSFFGPVKYSILPQIFKKDSELVAGNSIFEMSTFIAILTGTILGGILINLSKEIICISIVFFALLGWYQSKKISYIKPSNSKLNITFDIIGQIKLIINNINQSKIVFLTIIMISWFWFMGTVYLSQIPTYTRYILYADKQFVTFILALFTTSLSLGAFFCNHFSKNKIELFLVPLGAIGMSISSFDLSYIDYSLFSQNTVNTLVTVWHSDYALTTFRVCLDFFVIGFFSSFFTIPLYALLQKVCLKESCSQTIASNNLINSLFMIVASVFISIMYKFNFKSYELFKFIAFMNLILLMYFIKSMPELIKKAPLFSANQETTT